VAVYNVEDDVAGMICEALMRGPLLRRRRQRDLDRPERERAGVAGPGGAASAHVPPPRRAAAAAVATAVSSLNNFTVLTTSNALNTLDTLNNCHFPKY
jgi:hypothetical protein